MSKLVGTSREKIIAEASRLLSDERARQCHAMCHEPVRRREGGRSDCAEFLLGKISYAEAA